MTETVEIKLDPELHKREPKNRIEEIVWPVLDTVFNLLGETAVKVVLQEMREQAAKRGVDFPATDEELFQTARDSGDPDVPTSYRDLAPESMQAAVGLHDLFMYLVETSSIEAQQGIQDANDIDSL